jgi:hypothetical protein
MLVYFPQVVLTVNMSSNCHLSYEPIGSGVPLDSLHYVQPHCLPTLYPAEWAASSNKKAISLAPSPALIEDDTSAVGPSALSQPLGDSPTDMLTLATHLHELSDKVLQSVLLSTIKSARPPPLELVPHPTTNLQSDQPALLLTMSRDKVLKHIHPARSPPPAVRPCDTPIGSNTKLFWSSEEITSHHGVP